MSRFKISLVVLVYLSVIIASISNTTPTPEAARASYEIAFLQNIKPVSFPELDRLRPLFSPSFGGTGYYYGQCVWYAAIVQAKLGHPVPIDLGNANTWDDNAIKYGFEVKTTPVVGDVAQTDRGAEGHVAVVTAVVDNQVEVTEANVFGLGIVDTRWSDVSTFTYINFN